MRLNTVELEEEKKYWNVCSHCQGSGKKRRRIRKKTRLDYQRRLNQFKESTSKGTPPIRPAGALYPCVNCNGSGLTKELNPYPLNQDNFPHVAIVGGGIGGVALAVACLHRGIPFTLYERDEHFEARKQGYGLTLQQASTAIRALGIEALKEGVISTRHMVHTPEGKVVGEWGMRKWMQTGKKTSPKKTNIHIARQTLRSDLIKQIEAYPSDGMIKWGHQLVEISAKNNHTNEHDAPLKLNFKVEGKIYSTQADLVVGADGLRSSVRKLLFKKEHAPLRYLGCIVILGICPLKNLGHHISDLLDSATVFQTANGHERIYMMPYSSDAVMWQLSFPMSENAAKNLSAQGPQALKNEACLRTPWHSPIPEIIEATQEKLISGYPVYDRKVTAAKTLATVGQVTLMGDAAHPMSPFKGQGANQALLDALALARKIAQGCRPMSNWKDQGIREAVLNDFESEMLQRSTPKVKDSADAVDVLHSKEVLREANAPRGKKSD